MKSWRNIPEQLTSWPTGKRIFLLVYAFGFTLFNIPWFYEKASSAFLILSGFTSLGLSIAAAIVLLPQLMGILHFDAPWYQGLKSVSSNKQVLRRIPPMSLLYLVFPLIFVRITSWYSWIWVSFVGSITNHVTTTTDHSVFASLFQSLTASVEEVWRWSVICTVLIFAKLLVGPHWLKHRVRWTLFIAAVFISTAVFGWSHVLQYPEHEISAFLLFCGMGILFMLFALITGNPLTAVLTHFLYDYFVFSGTTFSVTGDLLIFLLCIVCVTRWRVLRKRSMQHPRNQSGELKS